MALQQSKMGHWWAHPLPWDLAIIYKKIYKNRQFIKVVKEPTWALFWTFLEEDLCWKMLVIKLKKVTATSLWRSHQWYPSRLTNTKIWIVSLHIWKSSTNLEIGNHLPQMIKQVAKKTLRKQDQWILIELPISSSKRPTKWINLRILIMDPGLIWLSLILIKLKVPKRRDLHLGPKIISWVLVVDPSRSSK